MAGTSATKTAPRPGWWSWPVTAIVPARGEGLFLGRPGANPANSSILQKEGPDKVMEQFDVKEASKAVVVQYLLRPQAEQLLRKFRPRCTFQRWLALCSEPFRWITVNKPSTFSKTLRSTTLATLVWHSRTFFPALSRGLLVTVTLCLGAQSAGAQTETILYNFKGGSNDDAAYPYSGLIRDPSGNFYGTSYEGGAHSRGTAYRLSPDGASWENSVLWSFGGTGDGIFPEAGLFMDSAGILWGTTYAGGLVDGASCSSGCGTFYALASVSGVWTELALFSFPGGSGGYAPINLGSLLQKSSGNFYGTTSSGGAHLQGAVYEMSVSIPDGATVETVLYSFYSTDSHLDGETPEGALVMDSSGNLFGTTYRGGSNECDSPTCSGIVFELSPPVSPSNTWTETIIHTFQGGAVDGSSPEAGLIFDKSGSGNLYGTTTTGGLYNYGIVFELSPSVGGGWTETIIYNFGAPGDGRTPRCALVMDAERNLYGTTYYGGANGNGTVFELSPDVTTWTESMVYSFKDDGSNGSNPLGGLYMDSHRNLYGTTLYGGANRYGTVFKVVP